MAPAETLTVPTQRHGDSTSNSAHRSRKSWQSRLPFSSSSSRSQARANNGMSTRDDMGSRGREGEGAGGVAASKWWKTKLFAGMYNDVRRRAPFYASDWKDAWDYRVVPATVYMYFAKYVGSYTNILQYPLDSSIQIPLHCKLLCERRSITML
jgi:hypothetical protein